MNALATSYCDVADCKKTYTLPVVTEGRNAGSIVVIHTKGARIDSSNNEIIMACMLCNVVTGSFPVLLLRAEQPGKVWITWQDCGSYSSVNW